MSERCEFAFCRDRATHVEEWEGERGGTVRALRCEAHALMRAAERGNTALIRKLTAAHTPTDSNPLEER